MKYLMGNDTAYDEMLAWKIDGCVAVDGVLRCVVVSYICMYGGRRWRSADAYMPRFIHLNRTGLTNPTHPIKPTTAPRTSSWR